MSSFDDLVDEMALGQMLKAAEPAMAAQLLDTTRSGPPHVRREALAAAGRAPSSSGPAWPVAVFQPRRAAQLHEEGDRSAQSLGPMLKAQDAAIASLPIRSQAETREERIARVRATCTEVLAKAMAGFEAGTISAQQVNHLETIAGYAVRAHVDAVA
jgi:hypothetical protein